MKFSTLYFSVFILSLFVWGICNFSLKLVRGTQTHKGTSPWNPLPPAPNTQISFTKSSGAVSRLRDGSTNFSGVVASCQTLELNYHLVLLSALWGSTTIIIIVTITITIITIISEALRCQVLGPKPRMVCVFLSPPMGRLAAP